MRPVKQLRGRDDATWPAPVLVVLTLALVAVTSWLLADSQADQRRDLRERYADRVDVATALIGSLLAVAYNGTRETAVERYSGDVSTGLLDAQARRTNARFLVVLDGAGNVLGASSRTPAAERARLATRPEFVRHALQSRAGYGLGDLRDDDTIASAVSFPTQTGVRVVVSAAPAMAFRDFLSGTLRPVPQGEDGRAWVFDSQGRTVASVNAPPDLRPDPAIVRRSLEERTGEFTSPTTGQERFFASGSIPDSRWRIVGGVSQDSLYESVSGFSRWTPWIILAVGAASLLGIAALVRRLLRTRARLRTANVSLEDNRIRLQERADELERSNADLEQFAYAASHDLSEPLRTVAGFSQLLASRYRGRLDPDADEMIVYMNDGVERMQQLIDDLLLYSRVGRAPLREQRVDLNQALDAARAWLGPAVEERGARITSDDLPEVSGEAGQLTQVFQNLLGNAIKFTEPGVSPSVHVSAARAPHEWQISVRDNGIGVEPAQAEAIFKMFGRLHPADTYPGTGIGLALVKRIVERHGGRIWVEPAEGGGSLFVFTLPARVPAVAEPGPAEVLA